MLVIDHQEHGCTRSNLANRHDSPRGESRLTRACTDVHMPDARPHDRRGTTVEPARAVASADQRRRVGLSIAAVMPASAR